MYTLPEDARVCIVLLTGLGDVVNGLPLVNAIRDARPGARITWVAEPMPASVLLPHRAVDEVVVFRKGEGARGVARLARELGGRRFDVALNLNVYFKSLWPTLLSRAPLRVGFDRARAFDGVWLAANRRLAPRPRAHNVEMFLEFLEPLGLPRPERPEWRLQFTPEERGAQAAFFAPFAGERVAALVPSSAKASKDWRPERWGAVAEALVRRWGFRVLLVGGPGERDREAAEAVQRAASVPLVPALGDGVRRIAWTLDGCHLVLGPDTGPLHIARALGVPTVGLFGRTNPWRVGPYGAFQELWVDAYTEPGERPDPSNFTPRRGRMETITVDQVLERVERAVAQGAGRRTGGRP